MPRMHAAIATLPLLATALAHAQPYDFTPAETLLLSELDNLEGHVAVIVRQDGTELYRFQSGDIGYDTKNRLASFTKTISAGVILSLHEDGLLDLDERLGDSFPLFQARGLGDPTVLDCWGMRHGITTDIAYEHDARFTLEQSVNLIGLTGYLAHDVGAALGYSGTGMQTTGQLAAERTGMAWGDIARARIFDLCGMPDADYLQFDPNPAIAGGLRASADETINYAQMIIDNGWYESRRVLGAESIELLFTNHTLGLPVHVSPWPQTHPLYPYGEEPDYGFGDWVLAQNPDSGHVEEVVGAGAWGSYIWLDRRRGITSVLITDVVPGSRASMNAALGLCQIARDITEAAQANALTPAPDHFDIALNWAPAPDADGYHIYSSPEPIRDIYDLRAAAFLVETDGTHATVPARRFYAVTALFDGFENTALIPAGNTLTQPVPNPCPADFNNDRQIDTRDTLAFLNAWATSDDRADFNLDGSIDTLDVLAFLNAWNAGC